MYIQHKQTTKTCEKTKKSNKRYPIIYSKIQIKTNGQNIRAGITPERDDETT